jgi:transcriptional regulator with XRE-family HTH domain
MARTAVLTERAISRAFTRYADAVVVGERIAYAREVAGVSQDELAAFAGLSRTTLRRIEAGERTTTGRERAAIARGLGVSLAFLATGAMLAKPNGNGNGNGRHA